MISDSNSFPISVLYVDDEEFLLEPTKEFLEHFGDIRVETAESGNKALSLLHKNRYDAIIADYEMAEMNGIDLLKKIRSSGNRIPFIIFTGKGREEVVIEALNSGADFYLQKGHDVKAQYTELHAKVVLAVRQRRVEEELRLSEERLRLSLVATNQGLWDVDIQAGKISANDEYFLLFGYRADELEVTYDWWLSSVHPDDRETVRKAYDECLSGVTVTYSMEFRFMTRQGDWKWILSRGKIVSWDESGRPLRMIGTHIDITDRISAENNLREKHLELLKSYEQIARSEEALRQLEKERTMALAQVQKNFADLSILNDGIRNPLTVMTAHVEMYCPKIADIIVDQAKEIDTLITQLDRRWIQSEKVINYLRKYHGLEYPERPE